MHRKQAVAWHLLDVACGMKASRNDERQAKARWSTGADTKQVLTASGLCCGMTYVRFAWHEKALASFCFCHR